MLRYLLQGSGLAQEASAAIKTPSGAWQGAWRRLYTTSRSGIAERQPSKTATTWRSVASSFRPMRPLGLRASTPGWTPASRRGFRFSSWTRSDAAGDKPKPLTLSQRLKKLFKDYGKSAIGVYLTLSVLDFPFCFMLVRFVGTEKIGT